jgi:hypothetical protein
MATITVYPNIEPRIILVDDPYTDITVQEVINLCRDWEDDISNLSYGKLISAGGKEALGSGGVTVGITSTLQNAQLMFEGRTVPLEDGTCTAADIGIFLEASGGDFVASGVYKGCTVLNNTTDSMASIYEVVSATKLKTFQITGGTRTTWQVGDEYKIYPNVQCSIDGGNLVAVDSNGNPIDVVLQSPNVQVIRSSSSSATNQELSAIQYSSFGGGVTVDVINGVAGTAYNIGTIENPVNNIPDALTIAAERGFNKIFLISNINLNSGNNLAGFKIEGSSHINTLVTIEDSAIVDNINIFNCNLTGILDGGIDITFCVIENLIYMYGHIHHSSLNGIITLGGGDDAWIGGCSQLDVDIIPEINMGGSGQDLIMNDYKGDIKITNLTGTDKAYIGLQNGSVILDSASSMGGTIKVTGTGYLKDELGNSIFSGIWNGVTVINQLVNSENIADAVVDEDIIKSINKNTKLIPGLM